MKAYETIIWASDGSDGADAALDEALRIAAFGGAHLIAVHCDQRLDGRFGNWPVLADEEDIHARIRGRVDELMSRGIDVELVVRHSHEEAADAVAAIASARDADLIVCGTRGLGALGRFVRGSFTQRLLHIAPCAVLAVPARESTVREAVSERDEVTV
jgi:nucleotide-binding universal stress UspA family protein